MVNKEQKEKILLELIKRIDESWTTMDDEDGFHTVDNMIYKTDAISIIKEHFNLLK